MNRSVLRTEVWLVLGLSLGASAVWSLLRLVDLLTRPGGLAGATTRMNVPADPGRPWLSVATELVGVGLALVPAALVLFLLGRDAVTGRDDAAAPGTTGATGRGAADTRDADRPLLAGARRLGLDLRRPGRDLRDATLLAALIGIPGLGLYLVATAAGVNTTVQAASEGAPWWSLGLLVLAAVKNGVLEEVVLAYLLTRARQLDRGPVAAVVAVALLRGCYHLYQGIGGGVGNVAMGLLLGAWFLRTRRVAPLVGAHVLIDLVAFVGYALVAPQVDWL